MLRITILGLGTIKESYWRNAIAEFSKRLQAFVKLEIKELKDISFSDNDNPEVVKEKEAETIKKAIPKDSYIIALDEHGKEFDSISFSQKIESIKLEHSHITFIIGGTLGLHSTIFENIDLKLSLSKSTITHQMVRVILLEQIYRASMISAGKPYHH